MKLGFYKYFHELPIGCVFMCNGNRCIKESSRTGKIVNFDRCFYFGMRDTCQEILED